MNQMKDNTLTISELAERWGMSRATIYRNRVKGRLPSIDFLGNVRFKLSDIEEIEKGNAICTKEKTTKPKTLGSIIRETTSQLTQMKKLKQDNL